eukprot:8672198-Alexandrium_andersonii.AAC.1
MAEPAKKAPSTAHDSLNSLEVAGGRLKPPRLVLGVRGLTPHTARAVHARGAVSLRAFTRGWSSGRRLK